ncbi:MAG: aminotransferase class I/II-fold pyridoxal phosphate-dependent enzyme [Mogibacterium sp.]|nr:aminotransferase class I/II-fold pyridoxal phosphate-dependent enzyme [Mogibacterium sp.]
MISVEIDYNSDKSLYVQLYEYLKGEIAEGRIETGERLPSLRTMSEVAGMSVTTVKSAYEQLMVEGYLISKPQSGYYAARGAVIKDSHKKAKSHDGEASVRASVQGKESEKQKNDALTLNCDLDSFDFVKWKKCMSAVLNETPELLLSEADRQGEPALREEIARYLYQSRGVICTQEQVVISAGTQQLINHLARILKMMDIGHVSVEDPGYMPVRSILRDWGFSMSCIPVKKDGIVIERLPVNIRTAAYICPQNQFPTGALMPISRRHEILDWAEANDSIIIEDDYDSELRYTGMPVPALQGIDHGNRVVYLGSFTSTLFPAIRISYMVLPERMVKLYEKIRNNYDQTCSKTEQLTLAEFMKRGFFHTNLRRVRKLYSVKLQETLEAIREYGSEGGFLTAENTQSGINIIFRLNTHTKVITEGKNGAGRSQEIHREMAERLVQTAARAGIKVRDIDQLDHDGQIYMVFYYNQIPLERIRSAVRSMIEGFKSDVTKGSLGIPAVYEVIRLSGGKPQFLKEHYDRLERSLASMRIPVPFTCDELAGRIAQLAEESGIKDHNIKIEVDISGHSMMYLNPTHYPSAEQYEKGVRTDLFRGERKNPNIKMMDHELRDATDKAIKSGDLYEVFLVNRDGIITEGSRSNVFFIKNGEVYTSPTDTVLPGVTRTIIIRIIEEAGIPLHYCSIKQDELAGFDSAFISGTSPKVLPVASIGDIAYDVDDPVLRSLMAQYNSLL